MYDLIVSPEARAFFAAVDPPPAAKIRPNPGVDESPPGRS